MLFLFIYQYYTYTGAQHDFHTRWSTFRLTVLQRPFLRVLQVEEELCILPEHMDSPRFLMGSCYSFCLVAHLHVFSSVLWCLHYFRVKSKFSSCLHPFVLYEVLVFIYRCYSYLFTHIGVQHEFHIKWCIVLQFLSLRRWVSLVEQKLKTHPDHTNSPLVFRVHSVAK